MTLEIDSQGNINRFHSPIKFIDGIPHASISTYIKDQFRVTYIGLSHYADPNFFSVAKQAIKKCDGGLLEGSIQDSDQSYNTTNNGTTSVGGITITSEEDNGKGNAKKALKDRFEASSEISSRSISTMGLENQFDHLAFSNTWYPAEDNANAVYDDLLNGERELGKKVQRSVNEARKELAFLDYLETRESLKFLNSYHRHNFLSNNDSDKEYIACHRSRNQKVINCIEEEMSLYKSKRLGVAWGAGHQSGIEKILVEDMRFELEEQQWIPILDKHYNKLDRDKVLSSVEKHREDFESEGMPGYTPLPEEDTNSSEGGKKETINTIYV